MNKVFSIPNDLVFSPCKVDGEFWSQFHTLISYLGNLDELSRIRDENPEEFALIIEPLILFVRTTEEELHSKGLLKEIDLAGNN